MSSTTSTPASASPAIDPITGLKATAISLISTPLQASLASIIANPTTLNVAAQGAVLQGALIGILPAGESDAIKAFAEELSLQLTAAVATVTSSGSVPVVAAAPVALAAS